MLCSKTIVYANFYLKTNYEEKSKDKDFHKDQVSFILIDTINEAWSKTVVVNPFLQAGQNLDKKNSVGQKLEQNNLGGPNIEQF